MNCLTLEKIESIQTIINLASYVNMTSFYLKKLKKLKFNFKIEIQIYLYMYI